MSELTLEEVRQAAREIVAEQGRDFVYNPGGYGACRYVRANDPRLSTIPAPVPLAAGSAVTGCLVGRILDRTGRMNDAIATSTNSVFGLHERWALSAEPSAVSYLTRLQTEQDYGSSWGEALDQAEELIEN